METIILGKRLFVLREEKNWTQKETAQRIGIAPSQLNRIEKGESQNVGSETLREMAKVFDVSADFLLGLSDYRKLKTASVEKLGLSEETVIRLMGKQIDPPLLSRMMEHEDFLYLMRLIQVYASGVHQRETEAANDMYGFAFQRLKQVTVSNAKAEQERQNDLAYLTAQTEATKRIDPTLDEIQKVFAGILQDIKKDVQEKKPVSKTVKTAEAMEEIAAKLPMEQREKTTADDVGAATWEMVADRIGVKPGKTREQLKKIFLYLFKGLALISGGRKKS